MMKIKSFDSAILSGSVILILLVVWEALTVTNTVNPFFVGQPTKIIVEFWHIVSSGLVFPHIAITLEETFLGLVAGTVCGMIIGFFLDRFDLIDRAFNPIFTALNGLPKMALAPMFILMFGLGLLSKVFLSGLMVFFLILFNTYGGLKSVDPVLIETLKLMNASNFQVIKKIALPSIAPWVFAGLQAGIGLALGGAVIGEYMGSSGGLGWMIFTAGSMFNMTRLMACLIVMIIILVILYTFMNILKSRLLKWRPPLGRNL